MALSDTRIKKAKSEDKQYKIADEKGMHVLIKPNGGKYFRFRYRFLGKENTLGLGVYPDVSLKEARELRDKARKLIAQGIDPKQDKRSKKAAESPDKFFEFIVREWYAKQQDTWATTTAKKRLALLNNDLLPWLGPRLIDDLKTFDLLACLQRIEDRGARDTAHNARQVLTQIFHYARITGRTTNEPERDLQGALAPKGVKHRPAIVDPEPFAKLLVSIDKYNGSLIVRSLLALCPILFQRPGEMISMEWEDIDFNTGEWRYIPSKTIHKIKSPEGVPHIVPLSTQAVSILSELHPLTGRGRYVFPSQRKEDKHASAGTINKALQIMGYDTSKEHCAHGFRSSARTMLDEVLGFRVEWIEHQLAHAVRDALGRAYNRTKHLPQRKEMMQGWSDYVDILKQQALTPKVVVAAFRKWR